MVRLDRQISSRRAAAFQCIAEGLRAEAATPGDDGGDLRRFAATLDHLAASLLVPSRPPPPVTTGIAFEPRPRGAPSTPLPGAAASARGGHG